MEASALKWLLLTLLAETLLAQQGVFSQQSGLPNPCQDFPCGLGEACYLVEDQPVCQCTKACAPAQSIDKVCSTTNKTFDSQCELERAVCRCTRDKADCRDLSDANMGVDYLHSCRELPPCPVEEMEQFPQRLRVWLYDVLQQQARINNLELPIERQMALSVSNQDGGRAPWDTPDGQLVAVMWLFCDMDQNPMDRLVSPSELLPLSTVLKVHEGCLVPFLKQCAGEDGRIGYAEWNQCMELPQDAVRQYYSTCDQFQTEREMKKEVIRGDKPLVGPAEVLGS